MDLEYTYNQIKGKISSLDFDGIWPGFAPLKFALYDDKNCFFDGRYVEKTNEFCANTSINYRGEQIAIWMMQEETDITVLTSKIVHEMFHGYQRLEGWDCWPNELEALYRYRYDAENLALKLREGELLSHLADGSDDVALRELLAHRKLRSIKFPYEFCYESLVEEIEGSANYVEWQVLKQLDKNMADQLTEQMRATVTRPEYLFPIRISGYFSGALMINALCGAGKYRFDAAERPAVLKILEDAAPSDGAFPGMDAVAKSASDAVDAFNAKTRSIIRSATEKNSVVLRGPHTLTGVNVYNARCLDGFITSTYFLMYKEGDEDKMLGGNFVIKMKDETTIDTVYSWE